MFKSFPKPTKGIKLQIQEALLTPRKNTKKATPRHIIIKLEAVLFLLKTRQNEIVKTIQKDTVPQWNNYKFDSWLLSRNTESQKKREWRLQSLGGVGGGGGVKKTVNLKFNIKQIFFKFSD